MTEPGRPSRRRRWPWVLAGLAAVLVLAGVAVVALAVRGRPAKEASVQEALERLGTSTTVGGPALGRPAQGVYRYEATGTERLSFQATSQAIGPTVPGTVTWQGENCWLFRLDYHSNHWQTWTYCQDGDRMVDTGGQVFQRFDFVVVAPETLSTSVCDPPAETVRPGMRPGDTWQQTCTVRAEGAGGTTTTGPMSFVGEEILRVGDTDVPTFRFHSERTYSGDQTGTGVTGIWFAIDTGLPVRSEWRLVIDSPSPIGDVTYTEEGVWQLADLVPTTGGGGG